MKKITSLLAAASMAALSLSVPVMADEDSVLYGTMEIPYAEFYAGEGVTVEVDAVSSATNAKWKNEGLVAGTYYEEHTDDEGGNILGVVYPVAIRKEDLAALGESDYSFTAVDETPAAYKTVTIEDGKAVFSAVNGETVNYEDTAALNTDSAWGDYQITVENLLTDEGTNVGTIYGVLLKTEDGSVYALRHLENIWRNSLAFTAGFKTEEPHGNTLVEANYAEMMSKTITDIIYITENGYADLAAELYVPVKFEGGVEVASAAAADGKTTVTLNVPEDFEADFEVTLENAEVSAKEIVFENALPGLYTLTVNDAKDYYAHVSSNFILTTDEMPVAFNPETGAIEAAEGAEEELAAAFIANLSAVTVNEDRYNASGRGAVAIFDESGVLDAEAAQVMGRGADATIHPIFEEAGTYSITVESTGFTQPLELVFIKE